MPQTRTKHPDTKPVAFKTTLFTISKTVILLLPEKASAALPSRGQTVVEGTFNGIQFKTPLEPDGKGSHWFEPDAELLQAANATTSDTVDVTIKSSKEWPEPPVPSDLQKALQKDAAVQELWQKITPMARWEWVRWTRSTSKAETRARRIEVACSKLKSGMRRPCCWNRNLCTAPSVSKNGVLLDA
jgi:hypothetical protein